MPKLQIIPSDLSAPPQTPCPPTFRLKDIHREMFQPKNILQEKRFPENQRNTDSAEGFQSPTEAHSRTQSFSRNAHEQGVCGKSEGFEGFFRVSFIEHDL